MTPLRDSFGRHFTYLRLSLTEKCNFKCAYCLPNGCKPQDCNDLTPFEIRNLLLGFRRMGFRKLRLTGGEPTLRRDIVEIVSLSKDLGFETVALSTNGYRLLSLLEPFKRAGLDQINVSLDSLDPRKFFEISGQDCGEKVLQAVHLATSMNFRKIKVNTVLLKGVNDREFESFLSWVREVPVSLRFIELMPTLENQEFYRKHHMSSSVLLENLRQQGWAEMEKSHDAGPAREFSHPSFRGEIGFISPFQSAFCDSCNRLRISAKGSLRLCLFGKGDVSLRSFLQSENQSSELVEFIERHVLHKTKSHQLNQGDSGDTRTLSSIGG